MEVHRFNIGRERGTNCHIYSAKLCHTRGGSDSACTCGDCLCLCLCVCLLLCVTVFDFLAPRSSCIHRAFDTIASILPRCRIIALLVTSFCMCVAEKFATLLIWNWWNSVRYEWRLRSTVDQESPAWQPYAHTYHAYTHITHTHTSHTHHTHIMHNTHTHIHKNITHTYITYSNTHIHTHITHIHAHTHTHCTHIPLMRAFRTVFRHYTQAYPCVCVYMHTYHAIHTYSDVYIMILIWYAMCVWMHE